MESPYASLIRAVLLDDNAMTDRVLDEIERINASAEFLGAAFHVALRRRFTTRDRPPVIRFVGEMRSASDHTGDDIDPSLAERAIQCVLDGRELDNVVDPDHLVEIEYLVIVKILRDAHISNAGLDAFFVDCNAVLAEYLGTRS